MNSISFWIASTVGVQHATAPERVVVRSKLWLDCLGSNGWTLFW